MIEQSINKSTEKILDNSSWEEFITATTASELCDAWLKMTCKQIINVKQAAILLSDESAGNFSPISVWPNSEISFSNLAEVVTKSLQERRGVIISIENSSSFKVAYPLESSGQISAVVTMEVFGISTSEVMKIIHWNSSWIANLVEKRKSDQNHLNYKKSKKIIDCLISIQNSNNLNKSFIELCQEIKSTTNGSKAAVGIFHNSTIKIKAISDTATLEKNSHLTNCYKKVMEHGADQDALSSYHTSSLDNKNPCQELLEASGSTSLLIAPLFYNSQKIAVITLEKDKLQTFSEDELAFIDGLRATLAPSIHSRIQADKNSVQRLIKEAHSTSKKLFGPDHLVFKSITAITIITVAILFLIHIPYKVSAKTVIEGEIQRTVTAPFNGYITKSNLRAGDLVKKDQVIIELDTKDLEMEHARWESEYDQYNGKLQQAIADRDLSAVQIIGAQLRQAEAQLKLTKEKIYRSKIKVPFNGIIISGDQSQQIGAPVEPGKKLFEIAPLDSYRVILQVDEREIRHIRKTQQGKLIISGLAGDPLSIKIKKITPVATAKDGKNYFRVEAQLMDQLINLRPGMEGIGKVETDNQSLFWIATHSFGDWLRMTLWTWLP